MYLLLHTECIPHVHTQHTTPYHPFWALLVFKRVYLGVFKGIWVYLGVFRGSEGLYKGYPTYIMFSLAKWMLANAFMQYTFSECIYVIALIVVACNNVHHLVHPICVSADVHIPMTATEMVWEVCCTVCTHVCTPTPHHTTTTHCINTLCNNE